MQLFFLKNLVGASIISMLFTAITVSNLNIGGNQGLEAKIKHVRALETTTKASNKVDQNSSNETGESDISIRETDVIGNNAGTQESFTELDITPVPSGETSLGQDVGPLGSNENLQENGQPSSDTNAAPIRFENFGVIIKPHPVVPVSGVEKRRAPHLPNDPVDPTKPPLPKPMPSEPTEEEKGFGSLDGNGFHAPKNDIRAIRIIRMGEESSEKGGLTVIKAWNN